MRLRLGIQSKLITTLILAGLLPLLLSLIVLLVATFRLRVISVGQSFHAFARQDADNLGTLLMSQVDLAHVMSQLPGTLELLTEANRVPRSSTQQLDAIESLWSELDENDPLLRDMLHNRVADQWRSIRERRMRFAEVIVTDASGRIVAATNKTSDYFQADEKWWERTRQTPADRVRLEDARWDSSAPSASGDPGLLVVNVLLPLTDPATHEFIGAMKVSIDVGWLVDRLQTLHRPNDIDAAIGLVSSTGAPMGRKLPATVPGTQPPARPLVVSPAAVPVLKSMRSGWIIQRSLGEDVVGFAQVDLSGDRVRVDHELDWYVIISAPRADALRPLYRLTWLMLAAGLVTIVGCFVIGIYVARREIIRPLLSLRQGVDEFGRGNINHRLPADPAAGVFRDDEIGRVANAFNHMADELRSTVRKLEQSSMLKQQFIDVAGHELRTPVTYILGVSQLAERQAQASGKENPLASKIAVKARRLGRIVDNMMKLLREETYDDALHLGIVDVRSILNTAHEEIAPFLRERSQTCEIQIADDVPAIQADAEKVKDIVLNLLSNAIRFSPDASIVHVTARRTGDFVEIDVLDEGKGIAREDLPDLFEPFGPQRPDEVMRHSSGEYGYNTRGIGLGLTVVRRFVDLHGGSVHVETSENGTRMRVRLPVHARV